MAPVIPGPAVGTFAEEAGGGMIIASMPKPPHQASLRARSLPGVTGIRRDASSTDRVARGRLRRARMSDVSMRRNGVPGTVDEEECEQSAPEMSLRRI